MRGSRVKLKSLKKAENELIRQNKWNNRFWTSGAARLDGLPGCNPPWKIKGKRFHQTAKLALSLDLVTKISQHNHFRYFRHHFGSTFPRDPKKQCFAHFQRRRLCDDVFNVLADEFGDFGAVFGTALKERNQTIGYKNMVVYPPIAKRFW